MLKPLIIVAGILAFVAIGFPVAKAAFGGGPNEATKLVEATDRTSNKAERLNRSFTDVIPPAPAQAPPQDRPQPAPAPYPNTGSQPGAGAGPGPNQTAGQGPSPSPTPDKYAPYEHPSEHAVRDAIEYLATLQTELQPSRTEYIQAVENLQRAWTPRYQKAVEEYKRFAYRIDHADAMAGEYFAVQENLTSNLNSPSDRRRAQEIDAAEREVYLDWRDQAYKTLGQAQSIMTELHDMNIIITKQSLSAHFAALYEEFQAIPPAITLLHQELARFRAESERIHQTFGVTANQGQ